MGEVKSESLSSKNVERLNRWLENPKLKERIKELFGLTDYEKWIYCWSMKKETEDFAKTLGINICEFVDIIKYLRERVMKKQGYFYEEYPNLMLLQFILKKEEGLKLIFG